MQLSSEKINHVGNTIVSLHNSLILTWDLHPNLRFFIPFWKMLYAKSSEGFVLFSFNLSFKLSSYCQNISHFRLISINFGVWKMVCAVHSVIKRSVGTKLLKHHSHLFLLPGVLLQCGSAELEAGE